MIKSIRVFTVCFTLVLAGAGLRAQSYTPVPYNFGNVTEVTDDTGAYVTNLSMDCIAANGYGQWTASYKTQNALDSGMPGLFLLGNSPLIGPAGIVSFRPFQYYDSIGYPVMDTPTANRSVVKNTINLKGRVRYVWPSADHTMFIVEGFDECPPNGNPDGLTGINLEFASYPYNSTYGSGFEHLGNDVIKAALPISAHAVNIPLFSHPVVSAAHEADPKDWYSISMDTTNLYIVYEEYDLFGHYNIWELTEQLNNGSFGPPIEVAAGARRPTVYAEVRRALPDTVIDACFDVSYITGLLNSDHLTWFNYDGSRIPTVDTMVMTKFCQDTFGTAWSYKKVLHACMLDASWENIASSDTTPRAIYAIVSDPAGFNHLIMYKIKGGAQDADAYYCDGYNIVNHAPGVNDGNFPVIDKPIRAFVNAYDGEKDDNFDEYHAMYQLARTYDSGTGHHRPLMMIHGAMVADTLGPRVCLNYAGVNLGPGTVTDRPNFLHAFYADPGLNDDGGDTDNYVGAVNQMGIHCHWRNDSEHYYIRDRRTFDEDIEENTLATNQVYIGDGTNHEGTIGATVLPGKTVTLWTNRIVSPGIVDTSMPYLGSCVLYYPDSGINLASVTLNVGTGSDTASKLVAVWNANIIGDTNSQLIDIKPNSSMEVYGYYFTPLGEVGLKLEGAGATMTSGTYSYPSSISSPAYLNLHGASVFIPSGFSADSSIITCEYDQDVNVLDSSSNYYSTLSLPEASSITNSIISNMDSSLPGSLDNSIEIWGNPNWLNPMDTVTFLNTLFNYGNIGVDEGEGGTTLPIIITGGKFNNSPIEGEFGPNISTIQNSLFNLTSVVDDAPAIELLNNNETYNPITISGCDFQQIPTGSDAIYANGYATDSDVMQNLSITGNTFNNADYDIPLPHAAIHLQFSEGLIADNLIEGHFQYGIIVSGANSFISGRRTKSTICSNTITAGTIAGIATDNTIGYAELNEVQTITGVGHISGHQDKDKIIYSNYSADNGGGIYVSDPTGAPNLTGIHSSTPDSIDVAAFDTIELNGGVAQISLVAGAQIRLGNSGEPWYWTNWSQNNILSGYSDDWCACLGGGGGVSYVPLIVEDTGHSTSPLGNISHNFFDVIGLGVLLPENRDTGTGCGDSLNRGTPASWIAGDSTPYAALGFCYSADSNFSTWQNRPVGAVDCGETLPTNDKTKSKGVKTLSVPPTDTSCREKFAIGDADDDGGNYAQCDSVLMEYIETCYDTTDSWDAFGDLSDAVGGLIGDTSRFTRFREWLKSVLWLNTIDPLYYCVCAESIYGTYQGIDAGRNLNASISVIRYLDSSGRCPMLKTYDDGQDTQMLATRHMVWLDTVNSLHHGDTTDFPEDTTVPTIDDLGLGILRGPPAGVQNDTTPSTGITNLTASENPFDKETTISFTMGEYAYVSFQVYDVLGRVIQGDYKGSVQGPGEYSFTVDGTNLPTGTYYARITTPLGQTRMMKLVKE